MVGRTESSSVGDRMSARKFVPTAPPPPPPPPPSTEMGRPKPSVEYQFLAVLRDARKFLPKLAPTIAPPFIVPVISSSDLFLPESNYSLFITLCLFCCIAVYSCHPSHVGKSLVYITHALLFAMFVNQVLGDVLGLVMKYLVCILSASLLGVSLATQNSSTWRSPVQQDLPILMIRTLSQTLTLDQAAGCIWFTTASTLMFPVVAGPLLCFFLILYSMMVGFYLGQDISITHRRLQRLAYSLFRVYRLRLHAFFDPNFRTLLLRQQRHTNWDRYYVPHPRSAAYRAKQLTSLQRSRSLHLSAADHLQQGLTPGGDRRSLLCLSFIHTFTVICLIWFFRGQPILPTPIFSFFITAYLFCGILYYSTEDTQLTKVLIFLSYAWLAAFSAGSSVGMIIMYLDSLIAAALFGATISQHRQRKGMEIAAAVALANACVHKKQDRRPAYYMIGFLALCYVPRLVWLIISDRPALDVGVSFFLAVGFLQVIYMSCIVGWLNRAIFDSSVPIFIYFASGAWIFMIAYLVFGEVVSLVVLWHCILASTSFLGYYSQVHAAYEKMLSAEENVPERAPRSPVS